jgi:hypothetical protein
MPLNDPVLKNLTPRKKSGLALLGAGTLIATQQSAINQCAETAPPLLRAILHFGAAAGGIMVVLGFYRFFSKTPPA